MDFKIGERKTLNRPTFLHEGIFVMKGMSVKILSIDGENITVEFIDREGFPHELKDVKPDELA